jgi:uncharacterized DUF497 family protein
LLGTRKVSIYNLFRATFDPAKDAANIRKHGISLARFANMTRHQFVADNRFDYGEDDSWASG